MTRFATLLAMFVLTFTLVGCSKPYVNIPAQAGDVASHDPNAQSVREAGATALKAVLLDSPIDGPVAIHLPEGTSSLTYAAVARQVGPQATPAKEAPEGAADLKVRQVRLRNWKGEVDVERPGVGGRPQLVTVWVEYAPFSGWTFKQIRSWRSMPSRALPSQSPAPSQGQ